MADAHVSPVAEPPSFDVRLAAAERDCHRLWASEPEVSLDRRRELHDELARIDAELSAVSLAAMRQTAGPDDDPDLVARLGRVTARLAALSGAWHRTAA